MALSRPKHGFESRWGRQSSYYLSPGETEERTLPRALAAIVREFPTYYGSRRVAAQLRRPPFGLVVNRKRVQRLMRELGLAQKARAKHAVYDSRVVQILKSVSTRELFAIPSCCNNGQRDPRADQKNGQ